METIKGVSAFIIMILGVLAWCFVLMVFAQYGHTQTIDLGEPLCDERALLEECAGSYPGPRCPNLGIPKSQYPEVVTHLPMYNGCFLRPLDVYTTVDAYRSMWRECIDTYAAERINLKVTNQRLRSKCGSKCKGIK